jgi:hypothetical protein
MGNNPNSNGGFMGFPDDVVGMDEVERAHVLGDEAKAYMIAHPGRTVVNFVRKLIDTHVRETIAVHWNMEGIKQRFGAGAVTPFKILTQGSWMIIFLTSLAGAGLIVAAALREKTLAAKAVTLMSPPLGLWAYYAVVHAVIISGDRYHMQSAPFIAMIASLAIVAGFAKLKSKARSSPAPGAKGA